MSRPAFCHSVRRSVRPVTFLRRSMRLCRMAVAEVSGMKATTRRNENAVTAASSHSGERQVPQPGCSMAAAPTARVRAAQASRVRTQRAEDGAQSCERAPDRHGTRRGQRGPEVAKRHADRRNARRAGQTLWRQTNR